MQYSKMSEAIPSSPIRAMMVRASAMKDVISFTVGEPDFAPADSIIEAGKRALDNRDTKYAPGAGITELREVYAAYLTGQIGVPYKTEQVVVTAGGMAALLLSLMCLLDPGDEVLVSAPYFSNYAQMAAMCYGKAVPVDVKESDDFELTSAAVKAAIGPKTKVLMLNSPCNPTGGTISRKTLEEIAQLAIEHDLFVISDEVYRHILFDGAEYCSIASLPGMAERTLVIDSCSKSFAMTGFRVGFAAGPAHLISLMIKLTEGMYSSVSTIGERCAIEAYRSGLPHCAEMCAEYQRRRDRIYTLLNGAKGIHCIKPKGAFYAFANISGTGLDADTFTNRLLEEQHVAVVPGGNFGSSDGSHFIRLSYGTSMENIVEGCTRIQAFCASL